MALTIEPLAPRYFEDAVRLFHAYRAYFAPHAATEIAESRAFLRARTAEGGHVFFLALDDGAPCGFIQLYPLWSSWYCRRIWFLSDLYVDDDKRGAGIASQLVDRVKTYARETNASSVMVELPKDEPHLYDFYGKRDFKRDRVFDLARYQVGG